MSGGSSRNAAAARSSCATADDTPADAPSSSISGRLGFGPDWAPQRGAPAPGVEPGELGVDLLLLLARGGISDAGEKLLNELLGSCRQPVILRSERLRSLSQRRLPGLPRSTPVMASGRPKSSRHETRELHVVHPNRLRLTRREAEIRDERSRRCGSRTETVARARTSRQK